MKPASDKTQNPVPWDQGSLDRLVDGEVSQREYQELVRQLEGHPDGWRACATAFLESQAWRQTVRAMTAAADGPDRRPGPAGHRLRGGPRRSNWDYLALVASVTMAILLGRLYPFDARHNGPDPSAVVDQAGLGGTSNPLPAMQDPAPVQFVNRGFLDGQSAIVPHVRQSLRRLGVQVSQQHGYIPLVTEDGTRVIVPYENVRLIPADLQPY